MKARIALSIAMLAAVLPAPGRADDAAKPAPPPAPVHRIFLPDQLAWTPAPPSLPRGPRIAVLYGDPNAAGPFGMRVLIPAGYAVMPHFHPADENMTVISGVMNMGVGDKLDHATSHKLPAGAVSLMPAGLHHFLWTNDGGIIQVEGIGPWGITYVDPSDDPRGPPPAAK